LEPDLRLGLGRRVGLDFRNWVRFRVRFKIRIVIRIRIEVKISISRTFVGILVLFPSIF
jgi:DNA relaxase NicK